MLLCRLLLFVSKSTFSKYSFRDTIRVTNSFDPDHAQYSFEPDLGSNSLQSLSAYDKGYLVIRRFFP